jgi:DNA-binding XRE family transcriptional regulator
MKASKEAQLRASVIMRVQKGQITATEGARLLGVSRKTYYAWEKRGLSALLAGVSQQEPGRPAQSFDRDKEKLLQKVAVLEEELARAKEIDAVRQVMIDLAKIKVNPGQKQKSKKNSKRSKK